MQFSSRKGYGWYVVFVLTAVYTLSFVDRQILGLLVDPISNELGISDTKFGLLAGFAFALFYTFLGLPMGRLADLYNRRTLIAVGILFWSAMTAACAAARNYTSLFLARIGVGVGEAALGPSAFSIIADYFPKERLGTALSVYSMGIFIGSGVALMLGGLVTEAVNQLPTLHVPLIGALTSWRFVFLSLGVPGILVAALVYTIAEPARKNVLLDQRGAEITRPDVREVVRQIGMRWSSMAGISLGLAAQSMCNYAFIIWTPSFFMRAHGWSVGRTGMFLGAAILGIGCIGMYTGGRLCDLWQKRGIREAALKVAVISGTGAVVFMGVALNLPSLTGAIILMVPGIFFLALAVGSGYASLQIIFPNQVRGQVSALLLFIINLLGMSMGPLLPGLFNDRLFHDPAMVGPSIALTIIIGGCIEVFSMRLIYAPYRKHHKMMHG